jgi:hypothetical protein
MPLLLDELPSFKSTLAQADVIIVGIARSTIELNADRPCGADLLRRLHAPLEQSELIDRRDADCPRLRAPRLTRRSCALTTL